MKEDPREYDLEEQLEDMKDFLEAEKIVCPNCGSFVDAYVEKCPVCRYAMEGEKKEEFQNKLRATMWSPGMDRGIPIGKEVPPPPPPDLEEETLPLEKIEAEFPEPPPLRRIREAKESKEADEEERTLMERIFIARESFRTAVSSALVLFGIAFYLLAALPSSLGPTALAVLVLGTFLVLMGGNLAFDVILERRRRKSLSSVVDLKVQYKRLTQRLLRPGDLIGKSVSILVVLVGGICYVLLPMLSQERLPVFVGMVVGAVLLVLGMSFIHNSFFNTETSVIKEKDEERVEGIVKTVS
ncbi:MAG: hypothetical protein ACE5KV_01605, partial [Thermoplasmata archaeon]